MNLELRSSTNATTVVFARITGKGDGGSGKVSLHHFSADQTNRLFRGENVFYGIL